ncbi:MAG: septum formation initiator family protein [Clostridia bacterium]|nr:septum formation initiator family protein [Clostridia bacterium]
MHQIKSNVFFKTAVVFLAIFCIVMIVTLQLQYNRLKEQKETLTLEIRAASDRIEAVQTILDTPFDDEYIIKIAREKLNLRLPEEVVFYNDLNN